MNTDIRLKLDIFEHPKVKKLSRRLGAEAVLSLLRRLAVEEGKTVMLVTHDSEALPYGTRIYRMESGSLA